MKTSNKKKENYNNDRVCIHKSNYVDEMSQEELETLYYVFLMSDYSEAISNFSCNNKSFYEEVGVIIKSQTKETFLMYQYYYITYVCTKNKILHVSYVRSKVLTFMIIYTHEDLISNPN